jgi:7,8-dihydro-6-hydroxymethylpterin-pyrophosphokinase
MKYFLGLGSNLGNPEKNIRRAIAALEKKRR